MNPTPLHGSTEHLLFLSASPSRSILYADIVGFTLLASECSPKELVLMLNELFGKFDQIAKVSKRISSLHKYPSRALKQFVLLRLESGNLML